MRNGQKYDPVVSEGGHLFDFEKIITNKEWSVCSRSIPFMTTATIGFLMIV